jgi:hypothetical protein
MSYWTGTDDYLKRNPPPKCPRCTRPMAAADDHGRFICICCPGKSQGSSERPTVVDVTITQNG